MERDKQFGNFDLMCAKRNEIEVGIGVGVEGGSPSPLCPPLHLVDCISQRLKSSCSKPAEGAEGGGGSGRGAMGHGF